MQEDTTKMLVPPAPVMDWLHTLTLLDFKQACSFNFGAQTYIFEYQDDGVKGEFTLFETPHLDYTTNPEGDEKIKYICVFENKLYEFIPRTNQEKFDFIMKNYSESFSNFFSIPLSDYMSVDKGFDIIRFTEWLNKPDDMSDIEYIHIKFGYDALMVINELVEMIP